MKYITIACGYCQNYFEKEKRSHKYLSKRYKNFYCSNECRKKSQSSSVVVDCKNCNIKVKKKNSEAKKSLNHFCSKSCAVTFNNKNKTHGNRRSKLEIWLEKKLTGLYPDLEIHYNRKDAINSELDIYIPSLKLAFELNGIFHYEPIYGENKLKQIENNDSRKFQACLEKGIELCIIDVSNLNYFKESNAKQYLDIILNVLNIKNGAPTRT